VNSSVNFKQYDTFLGKNLVFIVRVMMEHVNKLPGQNEEILMLQQAVHVGYQQPGCKRLHTSSSTAYSIVGLETTVVKLFRAEL
jgi:predicted metallopeptidase